MWLPLLEFVLEVCSAHTDTSAVSVTTTPLVDSSIHDRLVKACPLVDQSHQTHFKLVDVSNSESVNFLLQYTPDAIVEGFRSGEFGGHSVEGMKSGTLCSMKATVSRARCTVLLENKNPHWDSQNRSGSSFWARRLSR